MMWQAATIVDTVELTSRTRTLMLDVAGWTRHRAGQHVDVRLTADDGYQAARSYSLASAPGAPPQITVDRLPDERGERT
jgi:ferredoxin-NADP reductase